MDKFINLILNHWVIGLCLIISTFVTLAGALVAVFKWRYRIVPVPTKITPARQHPHQPVVLSPNHCDSPEDFGYLKELTIKVTGLVYRTSYDHDPPSLELYSFPFTTRARVKCEFPSEKARMLRRLDFLKLVAVVGSAPDGVQVDIHSDYIDLTLKNCRIQSPSFPNWIRYVWHELTNPLRAWWYGVP